MRKSPVQREINVHTANVKWLFAIMQESSTPDQPSESIEVVVQVDSQYGYRLVTLRSPVQVV